MPEYNYKHIRVTCPECHCDNILADPFHQETYCTQCGLILSDNTIFKLTETLEWEDYLEKALTAIYNEVIYGD